MATPQQQPQQPIYPHDLSVALDRNFAKFTSYTSSRFEELGAHMRIADDEALIRDNDLARAVQAIMASLGELHQNMATMRQEMATMRQEMATMRQEMADGFAAQAERHNELMMRVDKLEGRQQN